MRCQPVEYVCRNGRTAEDVGDADDGGNRHGVEQDDATAYNYYMMAKKAGYGDKADKALAKFKKTLI